MEIAVDQVTNKSHLHSINKVRMSLNMVCMSDISTAGRKYVDIRFAHKHNIIPVRNTYISPSAHKVTSTDWRAWRQWLRQLCRNESWKMVRSLGQWYQCKQQPQEGIEEWDCFLDCQNNILYVRIDDGKMWNRHVRKQKHYNRSHCYYKEDYLLSYTTLPDQ
jgi:hypothetical protein